MARSGIQTTAGPTLRPDPPARRGLTAVLVGALLAGLAGCSPGAGPETSATPSGSPGATADPARRAAVIAAKLGPKDLVGQVLMPFVYGEHATTKVAANRRRYGAATPAGVVRRYRLGGLILVRQSGDPTAETNPTSNINSPKQVRALTTGLQRAAASLPAAETAGEPLPMLFGTDQEHGIVTRVRDGVTLLPTGMGIGAAHDPELTERAWAMAGGELAALGINVDFAPDADVIGDAGNLVIGSRSYGSDPEAVAGQMAAVVRGLQGAGVAATLKHFPGHGHTTADSHRSLPVLRYSRDKLDARDLPPFRAGIDAGAGLVMSGHLDIRSVDKGVPATFSRKVLVDLLRDELGFDGVVVTDSMGMKPARRWSPGEAAVRAILAGNDLLLMPPNLRAAQRGLLKALKSGRLPRQRLEESVTRILTLKLRLAEHERPALSTVDSKPHHEIAAEIAAGAVTVLRGRCDGPLVGGQVRITGGLGSQRGWLRDALREAGVRVGGSGKRIHLLGYGDGTGSLVSGAAVTVGMDAPYPLASARSPAVVAAFGANRWSMRAVARVIAGKAPAPGRSPVPVGDLPRSACD